MGKAKGKKRGKSVGTGSQSPVIEKGAAAKKKLRLSESASKIQDPPLKSPG